MRLVFIYGPPAAGKYTIAKRLAERTGLPLFHNHLVVDAVAAVFPFASPSFIRLREAFWIETFKAASEEDRSLLFTFQPEASVAPDFPQRVQAIVENGGGRVVFVRLTLSRAEQQARIDNADRAAFGKLRDPALLVELQDQFEACEAAMPEPALTLDTAQVSPEDAAARIEAIL